MFDFFKRFSDPKTKLFSAIIQLWSSSKHFHNIFCWLEILNYCPDGGNGNFHCSNSFLKATSLIYEAQLSFAAHQKYIICFFSLWWMIKGIWALFSLLFIFLAGKPWLDNFMFIITLECSKLWIWMEIYFRDILLIRISRGANNCVQRVFEKNIYFIIILPTILNSYYQMKVFFNCLNKKAKGLTMQINFHSLRWSYLPRVPIFLSMTALFMN